MESKKKLRIARQEDDAAINVVHSNMTLDEWFDKWISICKKIVEIIQKILIPDIISV